MTNVIASARPAATRVTRSATPVTKAATVVASPSTATSIEFDSSAFDVISACSEHIKGLASCAVCLSAVESVGGRFEGEELIDGALPTLNRVIMDMADQIADAGDRLWEQYRQAAAVANGGAA